MKLDPIPQSWYDENRERFGAQTTITTDAPHACSHKGKMRRVGALQIECTACHAGFLGPEVNHLLPLLS